ncbi:MAG: thymidylate synthase [Rhodobacter sp.]|nr:thymidylate synthase [Rhodobacter sp.]
MRRYLTALATAVAVVACDGNPLVTTDTTAEPTDPGTPAEPPTTTDAGIPLELANNLRSVTYDPVAKTLSVEITGIDSTPVMVPYTRNLAAEAGLAPGYEAYTIQEDALDRLFLGVARESADGSVRGVAVGDGGQFNRFASGGYYERTGGFTPPAIGSGPGAGQVSYAGGYVGLDNYSGPLPPVPDPALQMQGPGRVDGDAFINANFSDMQINGTIFNRVRLDAPALAPALTDLMLIITDIGTDGTFIGDVEQITGVGIPIGKYGGTFGGVDAAGLAGVLKIDEWDPTREGESETGVFVLTQCGKPGEDVTLCAGTAP